MRYSLLMLLCILQHGLVGQSSEDPYSITKHYFKVTAGNSYGLRFWNGTSYYSIKMGNNSYHRYGPVQDYSIKMTMNNDLDRGWTWGVYNQIPVAALSTRGTFQLKQDLLIMGKMGIGTSSPSASLHIRGQHFDPTPNVPGTQIREGIIELTRNGADPWIDFQDDVNGTDYDARIQLVSDDNLSIYGAHLDMNDYDLRDVRSIQLKDWDDNTGGNDSKYRILARDGAIMFFNGGVVVGNYDNSTWTDLPDGQLIVETSAAIGSTEVPPGFKLSVDGKAIMEEVHVEVSGAWPDYVFDDDYDLMDLEDTERYIKENGHLPEMPSADEVKDQGINLGQMNMDLLRKVEELTLHIIEQQKQIDALRAVIQNNH